MYLFAIQVITGTENRFINSSTKNNAEIGERLFYPRRKLSIRKNGITKEKLCPLFAGYVFFRNQESKLDTETINFIKKQDCFVRILKDTKNPLCLSPKDAELIHHFINGRGISDISTVYFDENNRIVVESGPLKGLEGKIVKVDRRKQRAKISLDLYNDKFLIDLGFKVISKV